MSKNQAAPDPSLARQHALRCWHTNPARYPLSFAEHWERGDFDQVEEPAPVASPKSAA